MANSISVKPAMGGVQVNVKRTHAGLARDAVSTELSEAVSAAAASDLVRRDQLRVATFQADSHDVVLDAQSREVINQALEWSRRLTRQVPATAARRLKAYASTADDHVPKNGTQTDTKL